MSDERKPFAYLHPDEGRRPGRVSLYVGPVFIEDHNGPSDDGWGVEEVERINASVEAREAHLRAKLGALATAVDEVLARVHILSVQSEPLAFALAELDRVFNGMTPDDVAAVSGDVACGLALDLGAEKERTAAFAPLLDVLLQHGGQASRLAFELAKALGLATEAKWTNEVLLRLADDDELRAECRRRGWHPEMRLAPRLDPRARFQASRTHPEFYGMDPALERDEAALVQYDGGGVRHVVRIRNIDTAALNVVDEVGPIPDLRRIMAEHEARMPPAAASAESTRYEGGVGAGNPCANGRCSRFGTRHPGRPCDNRRARKR